MQCISTCTCSVLAAPTHLRCCKCVSSRRVTAAYHYPAVVQACNSSSLLVLYSRNGRWDVHGSASSHAICSACRVQELLLAGHYLHFRSQKPTVPYEEESDVKAISFSAEQHPRRTYSSCSSCAKTPSSFSSSAPGPKRRP